MKLEDENKKRKRKLLGEERRDELLKGMKLGEKEKDVYAGEGSLEEMEDSDEITEVDEGFMKGYERGDFLAECAKCKKMLMADFVEKEFGGELYRFCSDKCAEKFKKPRGTL